MQLRHLILIVLLGCRLCSTPDVPPPVAGVIVSGQVVKPARYSVAATSTLLDVWNACGGPTRVWARSIRHHGLNADGKLILLGEYRRKDFSTEEAWHQLLSMIPVVDGDVLYFPEIFF